jgi:lambda family phage portal protein
MNLFKYECAAITGASKKQPRKKSHGARSYDAAEISRLFADWPTTGGSADSEIFASLKAIRARSRSLFKNNDYGKRFFSLLKTHVIGPNGIRPQAQAKDDSGSLDKADNDYLEARFNEWCALGSCEVTGKLSFLDCQKLALQTMAMDGEFIVREITPWRHNPFGYAIQFIEADRLDHTLNKTLRNGNTIRMGVEFDKWRRPVNYHFKKPRGPITIYGESSDIYGDHQIIPAGEIIHDFITDRINQSRGVPWVHTAARRMHMVGKYEESELVASRAAANKMGFLKTSTGDSYAGDEDDIDDPTKERVSKTSAGTIEELPEDVDFIGFDPQHPVAAFDNFVRAVLRGAAAGLNMSYVSLSNDLRAVSYSSLRQGTIDERDTYRDLQGWMSEHFHQRVWNGWVKYGILNGSLALPARKLTKFLSVKWFGRGWTWVDPVKDGNAAEKSILDGFKSPQEVAAEQGRNFEDVIEQIKTAKAVAEAAGLSLSIFNNDEKKVTP